jgi:hypothetical protein
LSERKCSLEWTVPFVAEPRAAINTRKPATARRYAKRSRVLHGVSDRGRAFQDLISGWSNGQAEGQICKLKLVKRQMYGRGTLDLLQARVIGAT